MKMKMWKVVLLFSLLWGFSGCMKDDSFEISIVIPAGSTQEYAYSDEMICASKENVLISMVDIIGDTEVILMEVQTKKESMPSYLTRGMDASICTEKGHWYKVGIHRQNPSDKEMVIRLKVKHVKEVGIE